MGANSAAPVLFDIFDFLPKDKERLAQPRGVEQQIACWPGGMSKAQTPAESCERTFQTLTIEGRTPPTLEASGRFVQAHQSPKKLSDWLKQNQKQLRITSCRTGQHYFSEQLSQLPLEANQATGVRWYINGILYAEQVLDLTRYQVLVEVSACNTLGCDQQKIVVH